MIRNLASGFIRLLATGEGHGLAPLYADTAEGPSLEFLLSLSRQSTTEAWVLGAGSDLYAVAWFTRCQTEVDLVDVRVDARRRRQGLALTLLQQALVALAEAGGKVCSLEVRAGNRAAEALYRRLGFKVVGRRKQYYRRGNGREDAILMQLILTGLDNT